MLFLFPGSKLWRIAPGYPASHTHTHRQHTHAHTVALKSFTHPRPRTTFEKTASDRCPEQKRKLEAKKTSEPRRRVSPSPSPPRLRVPSKITSSFCFLVASGPLVRWRPPLFSPPAVKAKKLDIWGNSLICSPAASSMRRLIPLPFLRVPPAAS